MTREDKEVARIIHGLKKRVDRLENERTVEAVPNPLRTASDSASTSDSTNTATGNRGDAMWGQDDWGFTEWYKE